MLVKELSIDICVFLGLVWVFNDLVLSLSYTLNELNDQLTFSLEKRLIDLIKDKRLLILEIANVSVPTKHLD